MRVSLALACSATMVAIFAAGAQAQGKGSPKPKVTTGAPAHGSPGAPAKKTTASAPDAHASGHTKPVDSTTPPGKPTTTPTTAPAGATLTPVQQKLQQNTNLASKLQSRLPPGTNLNAAAADFKNLGQFVAAVNVSNNLGLDFQKLKTAMTTDGKSLGQAIQVQKSTADGATIAARAEHDAEIEIKSTQKAPKTPKTKTGSDGGRP